MAGLYLPEAQDDANLRNNFLDYSVSDNLDVLGATLEETFYYNPFVSLSRQMVLRHQKKVGNKLSQIQWELSDHFRDEITYPEEGFTEGAARVLAESYDERQERKEVFSRAQGGFGMGVAKFGVSLVGSMLDPLNIAASFVPGAAIRTFVNARRAAKAGETIKRTRLAQESAFQTGKTGKRFLAGAGEGMAGAALVEPIILSTAELEQDKDYTLLDSFLNVTVGGVLGGGLHVVGGKFSDRLQKARKETIETALRASIAQRASGKQTEINPILDADGSQKLRKYQQDKEPILVDMGDPKAVTRTLEDMDNEFELDITLKGTKLPESISPTITKPKSLAQWVRENKINTNDRNIADLNQSLDKASFAFKSKDGQGVDVLAREATDQGYFDVEPSESEFIAAIRDDISGAKKYRGQDLENVDLYNNSKELRALADDFGIKYKGMSDEDFIASIRQNEETNAYYESMLNRESPNGEGLDGKDFNDALMAAEKDRQSMDVMVQTEGMPDIFSGPDPVARDLDLKELDIERQQLLDEVEHYQKSNLITDTDAEEIRIANEDVERAETSFQSAAEAAARCLVR